VGQVGLVGLGGSGVGVSSRWACKPSPRLRRPCASREWLRAEAGGPPPRYFCSTVTVTGDVMRTVIGSPG
jgi:hypothetical protein